MVLFRIACERGPGVLPGPPAAEFFTEERSLLELPEAVAFISDKLLDRPCKSLRRKVPLQPLRHLSLEDAEAIDGELMESLSPAAVKVIDTLLDTGPPAAAAGDSAVFSAFPGRL